MKVCLSYNLYKEVNFLFFCYLEQLKPGQCQPTPIGAELTNDTVCVNECETDFDCEGFEKVVWSTIILYEL